MDSRTIWECEIIGCNAKFNIKLAYVLHLKNKHGIFAHSNKTGWGGKNYYYMKKIREQNETIERLRGEKIE